MSVGLVLSGGGARGIAHAGVLKALDEIGIRPDKISGTSAGALVGALYCSGHSPDEILKIITDASLLKIVKASMSFRGLMSLEKLGKLLLEYIPRNELESLQIDLCVSATNIESGVTEYFESGELVRPVLAACCVPVAFAPVKIENSSYVDGGILNNLPIEPVQDFDIIIGSHCNPIKEHYKVSNMKSLMERSLLLAINQNVTAQKAKCNLIIEPKELEKYGGFELSKASEIFDIGYRHAREILPTFAHNNGLI